MTDRCSDAAIGDNVTGRGSEHVPVGRCETLRHRSNVLRAADETQSVFITTPPLSLLSAGSKRHILSYLCHFPTQMPAIGIANYIPHSSSTAAGQDIPLSTIHI